MAIRVLYLPPSSRNARQLSRRTFLDEEIRALTAAGVEAYVVSEQVDRDEDAGRIHVRAVPMNSAAERGRTLAYLARCVRDVPLMSLAGVAQWYRAASIERRAAEVIAEERVQLIHSYFGWPRGFGGLLAKTATGVPLVASLRGCDVNVVGSIQYGLRLDASFDRAFRRLLRSADVTISVSDFLREEAIGLGAPVARARVILKGVRLELFNASIDRTRARAHLGVGPGPIILAVCGLVAVKGVSQVLCALAKLRQSHDFSFIVCGEGPLRNALVQEADRLGIGDRVSFRGRIPRETIGTYFAAADLFVQGSLVEASGNALLEAMSSALPIVCTDAGGPREYVQHGATGFIVPVGDTAAMAEKIRLLLDDSGLREQCGRNGRARAERLFSYDRMIRQTVRIYQELVGASPEVDSGCWTPTVPAMV